MAFDPETRKSSVLGDLSELEWIQELGIEGDTLFALGREAVSFPSPDRWHLWRVDLGSDKEISRIPVAWPEEVDISTGTFDMDHRRLLLCTRRRIRGLVLMEQLWACSLDDGSLTELFDFRGGIQPYPWDFIVLSHGGTRLTFRGESDEISFIAEMDLNPPSEPRALIRISEPRPQIQMHEIAWPIQSVTLRSGDRLIVECWVKPMQCPDPVLASDGTWLSALRRGLVEADLSAPPDSPEGAMP
jgi:hypothetical protein